MAQKIKTSGTTSENLFKHNDDAPWHSDYRGEMSRCMVCNRKVGKNPWFVEVYGGGAILDRNVETNPDENDGGYMGCYPVGSECARKFADGVLSRNEVA